MTEINLYKTENYKKFKAIESLGYKVENVGKYLVLVDKNINADQFIETSFNHVNEIITALSGMLLSAGYKVVAA